MLDMVVCMAMAMVMDMAIHRTIRIPAMDTHILATVMEVQPEVQAEHMVIQAMAIQAIAMAAILIQARVSRAHLNESSYTLYTCISVLDLFSVIDTAFASSSGGFASASAGAGGGYYG